MKNEKLLQMLGDIDEKHVSEANRDVELWLETRNGVKVTVDSTRKRSPWRIITAASCSAAAVIGIFALLLNVAKIRDIGNTGLSEGNTVPNSALSEQLANYKIENLDYENAVVIENVPNSGQWKKLSYERLAFGEKFADKLVKVAADYGVAIDKNDIMVARYNSTYTDIKPLSEVDLTKYENSLYNDAFKDYPYAAMFYNSDELYIHTIPSVKNWIELDNKKNISSVLGKDWDGFGAWRPGDDRTSEHYVDPNDENATCVLNGKTVKVADAVRNAQKIASESDVFPKFFDRDVINKISVFTYENGNQGLWIEFTYAFDGVTYISPPDHRFDVSLESDPAYSVHFFCGMLTENSIDWIWQYGFDSATTYTIEDCEININREDALKLVSQKLSDDDMFTVGKIQLLYADRVTDSEICVEPTWMIYIHDKNLTGSNRMFAYVSAVDGTIQTFAYPLHF